MSCTDSYLKGKIAEAVVGKAEPPPDELLGKAIDEKLHSNIEEFLEENVCNIICKMFEKHEFTEKELRLLHNKLKKM
jgi:hypothetical protein